MDGESYYTVKQAAAILDVSDSRIRQRLGEGGDLRAQSVPPDQSLTGHWQIPQWLVHKHKEDKPKSSAPSTSAQVESLAIELGRAQARAELTEVAQSTYREQLEQARKDHEHERDRADHLQRQLDESRAEASALQSQLNSLRNKGFFSRVFGVGE